MKFLRDNAAAFLTIMLSAGASLAAFSYKSGDQNHRIEANTLTLGDHEGRLRFMELHGHEEHARRITNLENQKADTLAVAIQEQGKQITILADTVRQDHDSIMKLTGAVERERR